MEYICILPENIAPLHGIFDDGWIYPLAYGLLLGKK